jgi:glycosyltransferase involved in cell wall biosynthesis
MAEQDHGYSSNRGCDGEDDGRVCRSVKGNMSITVIVCTYNRCQTLAKALESIAASVVPNSVEWEILVVDNNSTDRTREVVGDYRERYPSRFRYLLELQQGLSFARNAGIRESHGDVLAFTDDDVIVEATWLWSLTSALDSGEWAGTGGRIIPAWGRPLPRWLNPDEFRLQGAFVALDLGTVPVALTQAPVGANMAFRRELFAKYGGFRTDLGRLGETLRGCEDSEFGQRLLAGGEQLRYEPSAVVHHPVPENRLQKKYLLSWFFYDGRSSVVHLGIPPETKWFIVGIPFYLFRRLGRWTAQWLVSMKPSRRFSCRLNVWGIAGAMVACFELSRTSKKKGGASVTTSRADSGFGPG